MAEVKITALPAYADPASTDVLPIVDVAADLTKKVSIADLLENAATGSASSPSFAFDGDSNTGMYRSGADALAFSTGGTGRLFIDSSGNIGVGTASPSQQLHVTSAGNTTALVAGGGTGYAQLKLTGGSTENYIDSDDPLQLSIGGSTRATLTSTGLGIGTTTPDMLLHLKSSSSFFAISNSGDTGEAGLLFRRTDNNQNRGYVLYDFTNDALKFRTSTNGAGERMRIDSSGRVGIGTGSPGNVLTVKGAVGSNQGIDVVHSNGNTVARLIHGGTGDEGQLTLLDSNSTTVSIRGETGASSYFNAGNVGIGTSSPEGVGLDVNSTRTTNYSSLTDQRGLAHIIARNGSDGPNRFSSISLVNGGSTQAEASINLIQAGNYIGDLAFKCRTGLSSWAERMRIDSSGNVGIGTSSPGAQLQVNHSIGVSVPPSGTWGTGVIGIGKSGASNPTYPFITSTRSQDIWIGSNARYDGTNWKYQFSSPITAFALECAYNSFSINRAAAGSGGSNISWSTALRVSDTGNVGIGTSSPNYHLDVNGNIGLTEGQVIAWHDGSGNKAGDIFMDGSDNIVFRNTGSVTERMRIDSSGNVKITSEHLRFNTSGKGIIFGAEGGSNRPSIIGNYTSPSDNNLVFNVTTSERMRIDSSGRLLVGHSSSVSTANGFSPSVQAFGTAAAAAISVGRYVNSASSGQIIIQKSRSGTIGGHTVVQNNDDIGQITFEGSDGSAFKQGAIISAHVDGTPGANDMPGRLVFSTTTSGTTPTERMRIDSNGNITNCVGIYNNTTAAAANVFVGSAGDLGRSTSSAKYKTDIESIEDSYSDALLNCRPVWYRSICEGDNPAHGWWGFIAEEVAAIDPRLVHWKTVEITYDENGSAVKTPCDPEPEGVAYDRFVPHLLNLIKRQQAAIETLEQRLTDAGL